MRLTPAAASQLSFSTHAALRLCVSCCGTSSVPTGRSHGTPTSTALTRMVGAAREGSGEHRRGRIQHSVVGYRSLGQCYRMQVSGVCCTPHGKKCWLVGLQLLLCTPNFMHTTERLPWRTACCHWCAVRAAAKAALGSDEMTAALKAVSATAAHRLQRGIWTSPGAGDLNRCALLRSSRFAGKLFLLPVHHLQLAGCCGQPHCLRQPVAFLRW